LLLQHLLELAARERHGDEAIAERLTREQIAEGHRDIVLRDDVGADAAGIGDGDNGAAVLRIAGCGELCIRDDIAERALAGLVRLPRRRRAGAASRGQLSRSLSADDCAAARLPSTASASVSTSLFSTILQKRRPEVGRRLMASGHSTAGPLRAAVVHQIASSSNLQ
jgi:hypothetical protein